MKNLIILFSLFSSIFSSMSQTAGNSLHFDGTNDHVICTVPSVFDDIGSNDFTVEMWVKQENSQFCRLLFAEVDVSNFATISLDGSNRPIFYLSENGVNHSVQSADSIISGQWTHIAATWNATTTDAKIYINGSEVNYEAGLFVSSTGSLSALSLGSKTDGSQGFSGEMDEVSIWSEAFDQCEISLNRFRKRAGTESNLVTQFSFDHGVAGAANTGVDVLQDVTGNLNDGMLTNFDLAGTTSNWLASGVEIIGNYGEPTVPNIDPVSLTLSSPFTSADTYQWINCDNNNVPIAGATSISFDPLVDDPNFSNPTDYAVISSFGNCHDTSACATYGYFSTEDLDPEPSLSVYPNPSNGIFVVDLPLHSEEVQVFSLDGQLIERFSTNGETEMQIELSHLSGMYLVRVKTQSANISSKISIIND